MPKVSLIIPTYNTPPQILERAINSALASDYADLEVVVVDDGSRESCRHHLEQLDVNCRKVFCEKNQGLGAARDTGVRNSSGEFVTFLDSDDEMSTSRIRQMMDALGDSNASAIVFCGSRIVENGSLKRLKACGAPQLLDISIDYFLGKTVPTGPTLLLAKSLYRELGGFPAEIRRHSELDFMARVFRDEVRVLLVPEPLYTQHQSSSSGRHNPKHRTESLRLVLERCSIIRSTLGSSRQTRVFDTFMNWRSLTIWLVALNYPRGDRRELADTLDHRPWTGIAQGMLYAFARSPLPAPIFRTTYHLVQWVAACRRRINTVIRPGSGKSMTA